MRISPESGTSSMLMQRSIVDLPEPDAPRIEITSPSRASSETPLRTSSEPKLLRRFRTETGRVDDKEGTPSDMGDHRQLLVPGGWIETERQGRGAWLPDAMRASPINVRHGRPRAAVKWMAGGADG